MEIKHHQEQEARHAVHRARFTRYAAVAAAVVLVLAGALGIALSRPARSVDLSAQSSAASAETLDTVALPAKPSDAAMLEAIAETVEGEANVHTDETEAVASTEGVTAAGSYDELFALVKTLSESTGRGMGYGTNQQADAEAGIAKNSAPTASADMTASGAAMDSGKGGMLNHSETNVQVAGIDEADIVKTDGDYIYYVANNQLVILSAKGKDSAVLSATMLENNDAWWGFGSEMFIRGNRLLLITQGIATTWTGGGADAAESRDMTQVRIYDISVRENPRLVNTLGQSGSYISSRMAGDTVYLVTSQYFFAPRRGELRSYVPETTVNGIVKSVAAQDIYIYNDPRAMAYTVISSLDIASGTDFAATKALFGGTGELYCNGAHLLLANSEYTENVGEIKPDESGRNVQVTTSHSETRLVLFTLDKTDIRYTASATLPGTLLNQFAMDEYKDVFRIVVSVSEWTQRIYTDGVDSYEYEDSNANSLYTLDASLNILGSIEKFAPDEWVESVRFDGDVGYFVTFRQVDPLFTVDLSNPKAPKVLSSLKIPGFSEYLHVFGDGLLLGLGYEADADSGRTQGVKLSMFDTANKRDVRELTTSRIDADWSVVGSNHHAILVDSVRNLIAFPADSAYYIYRYEKDTGFTQLAKVNMTTDLYSWNLRGVLVGKSFYVLSDSSVTAISLDTWETLAQLTISYG